MEKNLLVQHEVQVLNVHNIDVRFKALGNCVKDRKPSVDKRLAVGNIITKYAKRHAKSKWAEIKAKMVRPILLMLEEIEVLTNLPRRRRAC